MRTCASSPPSAAPRPAAGSTARCGRVGLGDRADDRVRTYSQGMRQRLGVARCLLADPELLILDEPMNGLDPGGILEFREMIGDLTGEGRTVFLSSHLLDEVEKTCDAAAVIDQGRIDRRRARSASWCATSTPSWTSAATSPTRRCDLLDGHPRWQRPSPRPTGIRVTLAGIDGAASINARLVGGGVAVSRLEPVRESLEQRFLEMTSRVGGKA